MKSGQGKLSERLRNAPHLLADEQYLKWVIEQVEKLEVLNQPPVIGTPEGCEWASQLTKPGMVQFVPKSQISFLTPMFYKD